MKRTTSARRKDWFFARSMARAYQEWLEKRTRSGKKAAKKATRRPLFAEALEPRVLFSATPAPVEEPPTEGNGEEIAQTSEELSSAVDQLKEFSFDENVEVDFTEEDLERLAGEAAARWEKTGLTEDQIAALEDISYVVTDLEGTTLAYAEGTTVYIDNDAAGYDWFIDETESLDEEFVAYDGFLEALTEEAMEGIDLLSVIMHEQGHILGLEHDTDPGEVDGLLALNIGEGVRKLPEAGAADGSVPLSLDGPQMLSAAPDFSGGVERFREDSESGFAGFYTGPTSWSGSITDVASGTDGVTSLTGSSHAIFAQTDDAGGLTGPFSRFDGYRLDLDGGIQTQVAIYLDPAAFSAGEGFDMSVAASTTSNGHQQDFIFHVTKDTSTGQLQVGASNNTNFDPREDLENNNHTVVNSAGWYTLEHQFYENTDDGTLAVAMNLKDSSGSVLWTEVRNNKAGQVGTDVGGNRYLWFTNIDVAGGIAVDHVSLTTVGTGAQVVDGNTILGVENSSNTSAVEDAVVAAVAAQEAANPGNPTSVTIDGTDGDDVITIDLSSSNWLPDTLIIDGKGQSAAGIDTLVIIDPNGNNIDYTPDITTFGSGEITIGGKTIQFVGFEPVDFDVPGGGVFTLNLPNGDEIVDISNGTLVGSGDSALVISGTSGGVAFETPHVRGASEIVINTNATTPGSDSITITSADGAAANVGALTINTGGEAADSVTINGAVNFSGAVSLTTSTLNLNAGITAGSLVGASGVVNVAVGASIQDAIDLVDVGGTVIVSDGIYVENLIIDKDITLISENGRGSTTIQGISGVGALGAVVVAPGSTGVRIEGFTIVGIDNGAPGIENGALYFQGAHSGAQIIDNDIVANGDGGLITEYGQSISDFLIDGNIFSGQTFVGAQPGGIGFGSQFTAANVPRQLVVIGNGGGTAGTASATNITFTNNTITGVAGGISSDDGVSEQGNTLVTLDAASSTISGNSFEGTTTRYGTALRVRRPDTTISGNTFDDANMGDSTSYFFVQNSTSSYADIVAANTFPGTTPIVSESGAWSNIQAAIDGSSVGDTVTIPAGVFTENLTISKRITLDGAGSGTGVGDTIIQSASGSTPVITVTGSGLDAGNRLTVQNIRVTGAAGSGNLGSGILVASGTASGYLTFDNVASVGNGGHGIGFNSVAAVTDVIISNSLIENNGGTGIRIASAIPSFTGLDVSNTQINGNASHGFSYNPSGTSTNVGTDFDFTDVSFDNNGTGGASNTHDLSFNRFFGDASLTNVTVNSGNGTMPNSNSHGIAFRGAPGSAGTITLDNVDVTGHVGKGGILMQDYNDVSSVSLNDVDVSEVSAPWGQFILASTSSTPLDLGNTTLRTLVLWSSGGVDATGATFEHITTGAVLNPGVLADNFQIADQVYDGVDAAGGGSVIWSAGNVFVTPTSGSIQNAIDAASPGETIIVAAGIYTEDLTVPKGITISGANAGTVGTGVRGVETIIDGTVNISAAAAVTIDGVKFQNNLLGGTTLLLSTTAGHVIENSIFESTVAGGGSGDIGIEAAAANGAGAYTIQDNLFTGDGSFSDTDKYSSSAWTRGIFSNGGTGTVTIADNTFRNTRTGLNVDDYTNSPSSISGNTFKDAGSGISLGASTAGLLTSIQNNTFDNVDTDFNLGNLAADIQFDLGATGNRAVPGDTLVVLGSSGVGAVAGSAGNDLIVGKGENDTLVGNGGDDTIYGQGGDDILIGDSTDSYETDFDSFGPITFAAPNPMFGAADGWSGNGASGLSGGTQLDAELVADGSGGQALRISNAVTSGNYDTTWPFAPAIDAAGESEGSDTFVFSLDFKSATSTAQPGASMDITPGQRGTAVRQGILRVLDDATTGLTVGFWQVDAVAGFEFIELATNLDRTATHTVTVEMVFNGGAGNDEVTIDLNGDITTGLTTWEAFFRTSGDPAGPTPSVDTVGFRNGGSPTASVLGGGFIFDNLKTLSSGSGNDTLDGGAGIDTAVYHGNLADYTVTILSPTSVSVTDNNAADGDEGTDTLTEIENIQFADGTLSLSSDGTAFSVAGAATATTVSPDIVFGAASVLNIGIENSGADQFDRLDVTGGVTIDAAATLTVGAVGTTVINDSDEFVIISNDGTDPVTGTFAGLAEGAEFIDFLGSGKTARLTYLGGDGNDVAIVVDGPVTVGGTVAADEFVVRLDSSGSNLEIVVNGVVTERRPVGGAGEITIDGNDGADTLTIDYTNGDPINANLVFNGNNPTTSPGDILRIIGSGGENIVYSPQFGSSDSGVLDIDGQTITFTGLEPIDVVGAATFTLSLTGANDNVVLQEGTLSGGPDDAIVISGTTGGGAFETAHVRNTGEIIIDTTAVDGDDIVNLYRIFNNHGNGDLTINTGTGADTVTVGFDGTAGNDRVSIGGKLTINSANVVFANIFDSSAAAGDGAVAITADNLDIGAAVNVNQSPVTITQLTNGRTIGLGDTATGDLNLTSAELQNINNGALVVTIGDANTGAVDISDATVDQNLSITGASISVSNFINTNGSREITLNTVGAVTGSAGIGTDIEVTTLAIVSGTGVGTAAEALEIDSLIFDAVVNTSTTGVINLVNVGGETRIGDANGSGLITQGGDITVKSAGRILTRELTGGVKANGGDILLENTTSAGNLLGIDLRTDVTTTGSGSITLTGISTNAVGVQIEVDNSVTTANGAITITGTSANSRGIVAIGGSGGGGTGVISAGGANDITLDGTGGSQYGVFLDSPVSTLGGDILITGVSGGTGDGVTTRRFDITTTGAGNITFEGTSGLAGEGLDIDQDGVISTDSGNISFTGTTVAGGGNGVEIDDTTVSTSGAITVNGTGDSAATFGVGLFGAALNSGGLLSITGESAGGTGVTASNGAGSTSLAGDGITIIGTGNGDGTSDDHGVDIRNITINPLAGTNLSITGVSAEDDGAFFRNTNAVVTGAGTLSISGTGGSNNSNHGVNLDGGVNLFTTENGDLTLTGTASGASGVYILGGNETLKSTGAGNIIVTGTGGTDAGDYGVYISGNNDPTLLANTGDISITATSEEGIFLFRTAEIHSTAGDITLTADALEIDGNPADEDIVEALGGIIRIQTFDDSKNIGVGAGSAGDLIVDFSIIDNLNPGTTLIIGSATGTGEVDIAPIDLSSATYDYDLEIIGGSINVDSLNVGASNDVTITALTGEINDNAGTDINAANVTLNGTVNPGQGLGILNIAGNYAFGGGSSYVAELGGITPGTGAGFHDQVDVSGDVRIGANVDLTIVPFGGFEPADGQTFTLVDNGGANPVNGTFDGLPEGAYIEQSGFLYSISYVGGTGNDIVLTSYGPVETLASIDGGSGNLLITDVNGGVTSDQLTLSSDGTTLRLHDPNAVIGSVGIAGTVRIDSNTIDILLASLTNQVFEIDLASGTDTLAFDGDFSFLDGLSVSGTNSVTVSDTAGTDLEVSGTAAFDLGAGSLTLGDNGSDTLNFGDVEIITSGNATITEDSGTDFSGTSNIGGNLTLDSAGDITDSGTLQVDGTARLDAAANDIVLDGANDFSALGSGGLATINAGNVTINDIDDLRIRNATTSNIVGNLVLTTGGDIIQGGGVLIVGGTTDIDASGNNVGLGGGGGNNDFQGAVTVSNASQLSLTDTNDLLLHNVDVDGSGGSSLIRVGSGDITQTAGGSVVFSGHSRFEAGTVGTPTDIVLDNATNDFNQVRIVLADDATFTDANDFQFAAASLVRGDLDLTANGDITGGTVQVDGTARLDAGANDIVLNGANDFADSGPGGLAIINAGNASINDIDGLRIRHAIPSNVTGDLVLTTGGAITQGDAGITVGGTTSIDSGSNSIGLTAGDNDFVGAVSVSNASSLNITDENALLFGDVNVAGMGAGQINVGGSGSGDVTQTVGSSIVIGGIGPAIFTVGTVGAPADIVLSNAGNDFGRVRILRANDVTFNDTSDFRFNDSEISGDLTLTAGGNITATKLEVTGTSNLTTTNGDIDLVAVDNDFVGAVTATAGGTGDITLVDANDILVDSITALNNAISIVVSGSIIDQGSTPDIQGATVSLDGDLSPEDASNPGILNVAGNFSIEDDNIFTVDINGDTTPGTDHDQIDVTGTVTIGGDVVLQLSPLGYAPTIGDEIVIINNDGGDAVTGNFLGLPEGTYISTPLAGLPDQVFQVSYTGGDGNDVVLIAAGTATTNVYIDGSGNLVVEDILGTMDTDDNLLITKVGTDYVIEDLSGNVLGTLIVGATQTGLSRIVVPEAIVTAGVIINTLEGADSIEVGELGTLDGGIAVDGGDGIDSITQTGDVTTGPGTAPGTDASYTAEVITFNTDADLAVVGTGTLLLDAGQNVFLQAQSSVSTDSGSITIEANTAGTSTGNFAAIRLKGADVTSTSGNVTLTGQGGTTGNYNRGILLEVDLGTATASSISTGGSIDLDGTGGGGGSFGTGVEIIAGTVESTGAGPVTISGTGGDGTMFNVGVAAFKGARIDSGTGDLNIDGTGGSTGTFSRGVQMGGLITLISDGGNITVDGTGGGAATGMFGVGTELVGVDIDTTGSGTVTLSGTGNTGTMGNIGVKLAGATTVDTVDGAITLDGTGQGTTLMNHGVQIAAGSHLTASGSGALTVRGTGSATGSMMNFGAEIASFSILSVADGDLTVEGTGGGTASMGKGLSLASSTLTSSGTGDITVTGTGSTGTATGMSFGIEGVGVTISTTGTSTGNITLTGSGGTGTMLNVGVKLASGSAVSTVGGHITLTGTGGGTGMLSSGIQIAVSSVSAGGSGNLTLTGLGADGANMNNGVQIDSGSTLSTVDGDLQMTGTARGTGLFLTGVKLTGSHLSSSGTGSISVDGTSTQQAAVNKVFNTGINMSGGSITTNDGEIDLTGTGGQGSTLNQGIRVVGATLDSGTRNMTIVGTAHGSTTGLFNSGVYLLSVRLGGGVIAVGGSGGGLTSGLGTIGLNHGIFMGGITLLNAPTVNTTGVSGFGTSSKDEDGNFFV